MLAVDAVQTYGNIVTYHIVVCSRFTLEVESTGRYSCTGSRCGNLEKSVSKCRGIHRPARRNILHGKPGNALAHHPDILGLTRLEGKLGIIQFDECAEIQQATARNSEIRSILALCDVPGLVGEGQSQTLLELCRQQSKHILPGFEGLSCRSEDHLGKRICYLDDFTVGCIYFDCTCHLLSGITLEGNGHDIFHIHGKADGRNNVLEREFVPGCSGYAHECGRVQIAASCNEFLLCRYGDCQNAVTCCAD